MDEAIADRERRVAEQSGGDEGAEQTETNLADQSTEEGAVEVGQGAFGKIYDRFKGKAKAALVFLRNLKSGQARGVFHRDEIGDIDLVKRDAPNPYMERGIAYIDRKHVKVLGNFESLVEAREVIDDIIKKGKNYFR